MPEIPNTLTVDAGYHDRRETPLSVQLPEGSYQLVSPTGAVLPLQHCENNTYTFVEPNLPAGERRSYKIAAVASTPHRVVLAEEQNKSLEIRLDGELLTRYHYADVKARPYFYPVLAPESIPLTRAYPMIPDDPNEQHDHPHHRSLWIAYGEVNETDNWSEETGHGHTEHQCFQQVTSGSVFGRFHTESLWTTAQHSPLLDQNLVVTTWATGGGVRLLDFDIRLKASYETVHFGDTKEGGILSVRVATVLDVPRTGRITNSYGGINEGETWGKAAHWCDYSGLVEGKPVGVAVCDHPHSFRYPSHWHVRNYGLMTANPFGYSYYTEGVKNGAHTLEKGDTLEFHYRLILHGGGAEEAQINDHYLDYVSPPRVTLT